MRLPSRRSVIAFIISPLVALAAVALLIDLRDRAVATSPPASVPLFLLLRLYVVWIADRAARAYVATALLAVPIQRLITRRAPPRLFATVLLGVVTGVATASWQTFQLNAETWYLGSFGGVIGALTYWYVTHFSYRELRAAV